MGRTDKLTLRTAVEGDLEQICALLTERGDEADAEDLRLVVYDAEEGLDSVMVVVDGDRVVSTATLLRELVFVGEVAVPTGQVEMVATDPSYEGRGLVRALMDEAHRRSADRGDVLQVMIGIPFFYRQFGYSYTMPIPLPWNVHTATTAPADPSIRVRAARLDDIPAMAALQTAAQATADIRMPHSAGCWRWLVQRSGSTQLVAEHDGTVVATARQTPPDDGVVLGEVAGRADGIRMLISAATREGDVAVLERPASDLDATLAEIAAEPEAPDRAREWFYARVPALAPLLDHLRPVLLERFRSAGIGGHHEVLLSTWRSHVRFSIDEDSMSTVVAGGPEQAPISKGGSGVPPDVLAPLILGPLGAAGLEAGHGDVLLGRQRDLIEALFPPVTSDLLTFYLAL